MKKLNREFTTREKLLILLLCLILVGLAYYQFVDQPVRQAIISANAERDSLNLELTTLQAKLTVMRRMYAEMEDLTEGGTVSEMKSYNNIKPEIKLLNDILRGTPDYSISFADVTRDGEQIRRNVSLTYSADSYDTVQSIVKQLSQSPYRCLVGDMKIGVGRSGSMEEGPVTVNMTATFYETMVGGTADAGLPASKSVS